MTTCEEVRIELGGYVLGGLTDVETRRVAEHVRRCRRCRAEVDELAPLPGLLSLANEAPPAPPERLRERVLTTPRRQRARRRLLVVVAAVLLGVVLGGVGVRWLGQPPPGEPAVALALQSGEGFDASGRALVRPTSQTVRLELAIDGLEPLPGDGMYEAWLAPRAEGQDQKPISIGAFHPTDDGSADLTLQAEGSLDRYRSFWVTAEPDAVEGSHDGPTVVFAEFPDPP